MVKLPVGVIGTGHLGSLHAKMYAEISSVELVGIFDADQARAKQVADENKTSTFSSIEELLSTVKAVSIVTPTVSHYDIGLQAINCGVHAFIEKPITTTVEQAGKIVKLSSQKNVKVQVGHIERFNPAILALDKYRVKPMFVESHRLAQFNPRGTDVAVVLDLMIHDIDIIMSLVGSPVEQIEANGVAVVSDNLDIANARLQFANGCVANVTASRISQKKMRKMRMFQRDAYISVDFSDGVAEVFRLVDENDPSASATMMLGKIESGQGNRKIIYERPEIKEVNALRYELELFVNAINNDTQTAVTAEEGMHALRIAHEIMERINSQKMN